MVPVRSREVSGADHSENRQALNSRRNRRRVAASIGICGVLFAIVGAFVWSDQFGLVGAGLAPPTAPAGAPPGDPARSSDGRTGDAEGDGGAAVSRGASMTTERGRSVAILVIDEDSLRPVPAASVWYMPPRTPDQHESDAERFDEEDDETYLRLVGCSVECDAGGRVLVVADGNTPVFARLGDQYGEAFVEGESEDGAPVVVRLARDITLRVEVVDQAGQPVAGLYVDVESRSVCRRRGRESYSERIGPTDGSGFASLPHLQQRMALPGPHVLSFAMELMIGTHHLSKLSRSVAADELLAAPPLRMVVPVGGLVELRVVDADGQPYTRVAPMLKDVGSDTWCQAMSGAHGRIRYAQVPLGRRWMARVRDQDAPAAVEFDGPSHADAVVVVELRVPRRASTLRGRLLQEGRPLVKARVSFLAHPGGGFAHGQSWVETDERGCFVLAGTMPEHAAPRPVALEIKHVFVPAGTKVECIQSLAPGDIDLGDLELPSIGPVRRMAVVHVRAEDREVSATARVTIYSRHRSRRESLTEVPVEPRATAGGIELWGREPDGEFVLRVSHPGYGNKLLEVRLPDEVAVELEPNAVLWASLVAPVAPRDSVDVMLVPEGKDARDGRAARSRRQDQWEWSVSPGRYRLAVDLAGVIVHETETFPLVAGTNHWPGFGSLRDLRHVGRIAHLEAVDADSGVGLDTRLLRVGRDDDGEYQVAEVSEWVLAAAEGQELLVFAEGYQPARVRSDAQGKGDQRIPLPRMTTLRVVPLAGATETIVRIVEDGVRDPLLREHDSHSHDTESSRYDQEPFEFVFAPTTVLELVAIVDDVPRPAQRVVVGAYSPQEVICR